MGTNMNIRIGNLTFDHGSYDREGDVLYLHRGMPRKSLGGEETPEGHLVRFDANGEVIGLTIMNVRQVLGERAGSQ
jgi:uncharacterized protein YuzE